MEKPEELTEEQKQEIKREKRRQKILAKGASRLNKITGVADSKPPSIDNYTPSLKPVDVEHVQLVRNQPSLIPDPSPVVRNQPSSDPSPVAVEQEELLKQIFELSSSTTTDNTQSIPLQQQPEKNQFLSSFLTTLRSILIIILSISSVYSLATSHTPSHSLEENDEDGIIDYFVLLFQENWIEFFGNLFDNQFWYGVRGLVSYEIGSRPLIFDLFGYDLSVWSLFFTIQVLFHSASIILHPPKPPSIETEILASISSQFAGLNAGLIKNSWETLSKYGDLLMQIRNDVFLYVFCFGMMVVVSFLVPLGGLEI